MRRFKKLMAILCSAVCAFSLMATPVYADTDGTEIQVAQSSKLEIQLGAAWSGVEFQLKTDAGMYPNTIVVGEDGVLRLEIGGSSTYTLTCLNSGVAAPWIGEAVLPETENPDTEATPASEQDAAQQTPDQTEPTTDPDSTETPSPDESTEEIAEDTKEGFAGIPTMHIVLFGGGLLLAVGGLIAIRVISKRREERGDDDDDYDDYDDDYDD